MVMALTIRRWLLTQASYHHAHDLAVEIRSSIRESLRDDRVAHTAAIPMGNPYCSCELIKLRGSRDLQLQSLWVVPVAAVIDPRLLTARSSRNRDDRAARSF